MHTNAVAPLAAAATVRAADGVSTPSSASGPRKTSSASCVAIALASLSSPRARAFPMPTPSGSVAPPTLAETCAPPLPNGGCWAKSEATW
eukprot:3400483-Pleurochrysis_carterae.AAC.1